MRYFAGVDPGAKGAMALVDEQGGFVSVGETILHPPTGLTATLVALEKVHSMPKQGVASSFKFGEASGWWKGWFDALNIAYVLVTPTRWQKAVLDFKPTKGEIKKAVWEFAHRRWPMAPLAGPRGARLYGRSDALCLAEYARQVGLAGAGPIEEEAEHDSA